MNRRFINVRIVALGVSGEGVAVFIGNEEKAFNIVVDAGAGAAIATALEGIQMERPLIHDLISRVLLAFGAKIERAIVSDLNFGRYFARLILSVENELNSRKTMELDALPGDCIGLAVAQHAPLYVTQDVWRQVRDVTEVLRKIQEDTTQGGDSGHEEP